MATKEEKGTVPTTAAEKKKRKLKKTLAAFTPYVKWHPGLIICGTVERKFINMSNFGEKSNIEVKLADPCEFTDTEGEVKALAAGEMVNIGHVAGLNNAMTLPIGTLFQIECTGKKELGKGRQPAWEFEVTYE